MKQYIAIGLFVAFFVGAFGMYWATPKLLTAEILYPGIAIHWTKITFDEAEKAMAQYTDALTANPKFTPTKLEMFQALEAHCQAKINKGANKINMQAISGNIYHKSVGAFFDTQGLVLVDSLTGAPMPPLTLADVVPLRQQARPLVSASSSPWPSGSAAFETEFPGVGRVWVLAAFK
jgi:hypothetical protein